MHRTVYDGEVASSFIWARIDGWWRRFQIREVEDTFWNWNFEERLRSFEEQLSAEPYEYRAGGPHSPSLATYGNWVSRGEIDLGGSAFHINNKIIGINCVPDKDHIKDLNEEMLDMIDTGADFKTKVAWLKGIHEQSIWRRDLQAGVEYFTTPEFETHTFLNLMENPASTLCYQGRYDIFTSFELRCIAQIVHPNNPDISDELLQIAKFPAILHGFYHDNVPVVPGVLYWHIEEFDNSVADEPGKRVVKTR